MQGEGGESRKFLWIATTVIAALLLIAIVWNFILKEDSHPSVADQTRSSLPVVMQDEASNSRAESTLAQDDRFVGSHQCGQCHSEIAAAYKSHPMANSISRVTGLPTGSENASRFVPGRTRRYEVVFQEGRMIHRDEMFDADGQSVFSQSVQMDYVVGSGRRAFAYLSQQGELLFQSPLNWYSQLAKWDVSPGYRPDDERRFRRRITDDCLSCHAGRVRAVGHSPNRYQQPAFLEMSIGCENCHGPGKDHLEFHNAEPRVTGIKDPIVNPGRLDTVERESVCNQCHLQTAARIPRFGCSDFDFRPGQRFEEIWSALDAGTGVSGDGRTRAVSHVQQMRESGCYVASDGRLGCISCHDPHRLPPEHDERDFYRNRCLKCHSSDDCDEPEPGRLEKSDSCVACHMPRRDSSNISHVTQTDHRILRSPVDSTGSVAEGNVQLRFFDGAHLRLEEWEQNRAMGVGIWSYLSRKGQESPPDLARLLESGLTDHPDDGLVLSTLGALAMQHQRSELAVQYLTRALAIPLSEEAAVSGLLDLHYQQADWAKALVDVERCLELDPGHPGYHAIRADALMNAGRLTEGITSAERSLELDPTRMAVRLCRGLESVRSAWPGSARSHAASAGAGE